MTRPLIPHAKPFPLSTSGLLGRHIQPKGPSAELIAAIVELKRRNPKFGCVKIAQQIAHTFNVSVGDAVRHCRENVVLSRYLVHHVSHRGGFKPGDRLNHGTIGKGFATARDATGLRWPVGKTPPSFHELRSLSERLYKAQGVDTRVLLGHKHERTTALYHDTRGAEWMVVKV